MSDKRLDQIVKETLDEYRSSYKSSHWEKMEQLMDSRMLNNPNNQEAHFDQLLKSKLKGHQVRYNENSWLDLQSTLENKINDQHVDHEIKNRLRHHTVQYQESHWEILKAKLELEKKLKKNIFWTKTSEVAIIALLLFSYLHLDPYIIQKEVNPETKKHLLASSDNTKLPIEVAANSNNRLQVVSILEKLSHTEQLSQSSINFITKKDGDLISLDKPISATNSIVPMSKADHTKLRLSASVKTQADDVGHLNTPNVNLNDHKKSFEQMPTAENDKWRQLINPLAYIDVEPINTLILNNQPLSEPTRIASKYGLWPLETYPNPVQASVPVIAKVMPETEKWIGLSTGADLNFVKTPIDIDFIKVPRDFVTTSLTNGLNYGVSRGKHEFFTGVYYSVKIYDPNIKEQLEVNKSYYVRDHVEEKFQIIHLPFQYRRHIGDLDKLHAYLVSGLAINGVMYAEYTYDDLLKRGDPRPDYALNQAARYRQSDFHKGLLDGGHIKHNLYLTAQAGMGIERRFQRMSIFFDAVYQKNLFSTKLGPRDVQLNSVSFNIGTRYKI